MRSLLKFFVVVFYFGVIALFVLFVINQISQAGKEKIQPEVYYPPSMESPIPVDVGFQATAPAGVKTPVGNSKSATLTKLKLDTAPVGPLTCKTRGGQMVPDGTGLGEIGCDMIVLSGKIDLSKSYCESELTHRRKNLIPDLYERQNWYWATLTNLQLNERVHVYAVSTNGEKVECGPVLNQ